MEGPTTSVIEEKLPNLTHPNSKMVSVTFLWSRGYLSAPGRVSVSRKTPNSVPETPHYGEDDERDRTGFYPSRLPFPCRGPTPPQRITSKDPGPRSPVTCIPPSRCPTLIFLSWVFSTYSTFIVGSRRWLVLRKSRRTGTRPGRLPVPVTVRTGPRNL